MGQRLIDRAGLLSADEAADLVSQPCTDRPVELRRVTMWEIVSGH
jgi:hypothetical protein